MHRLDARIEYLENLKKKYLDVDFDLATDVVKFLPRVNPITIDEIVVTRDDYERLVQVLECSVDGALRLIGATGSGKSTFGIVPLFRGRERRVLTIQPNKSNLGNQLADFNKLMPVVNFNAGMAHGRIPHLQYINLMATAQLYPEHEFYCTTVNDFVQYLRTYGCVPPFTTFVLDEYHLITADMKLAYTLLTAVDHGCEVIFSSATPPNGIITSPMNAECEIIRVPGMHAELPPHEIRGTVWDPSHLMVVQGLIAYFVPTAAVADALANSLSALNIASSVSVIDENTSVEEYETVRNIRTDRAIVILTPLVEAGITLPDLKVLINSGLTYTVVLDKGVIYEKERYLTRSEERQRFGRAGRTTPGYIITPEESLYHDADSAAEFFEAQANIFAISLGVPYQALVSRIGFADAVLSRLTQASARKAVADHKFGLFTAAHRYNKYGELYKELGGTADGFKQDMIDSLRLYTYNAGRSYFIAPIVDLTNVHDKPDSFITDRLVALSFSNAILARASVSLSFAQMVAEFAKDPRTYMLDLIRTIAANKDLTDKRYRITGTNNRPSWRVMFNTPELVSLFTAVESICPIDADPFDIVDKDISFGFSFNFCGEKCALALPRIFLKDPDGNDTIQYDVKEANKIYSSILSAVVAVASISAHTDRHTDLDQFRQYVSRDHAWFGSNVGFA